MFPSAADIDGNLFSDAHDWPITLSDYTYLIRKLMLYEPEAIFIDLHLGHRDDPGREPFRRYLQSLRSRVQIYLAELAPGPTQPAGKVPPQVAVDPLLNDVIAGRVLAGWDGFGDAYPIALRDQSGTVVLSPAAQLWLSHLQQTVDRTGDFTQRSRDQRNLTWLTNLVGSSGANAVPSPMVVRWGAGLPGTLQDTAQVCGNNRVQAAHYGASGQPWPLWRAMCRLAWHRRPRARETTGARTISN